MSHAHKHRPHRSHSQYARRAAKATAAGAAAAAAVPLSERLFGQERVKQAAEEVFAALPENKLGLLSLGFLAGGVAGIWLNRGYASQIVEERQRRAGAPVR